MTRTNAKRKGGQARLPRKIVKPVSEVSGPAPGLPAPGSPERLLAHLFVTKHQLDRLQAEVPETIAACRAAGVSWSAIAGALGVSRQAATKRYGGVVT